MAVNIDLSKELYEKVLNRAAAIASLSGDIAANTVAVEAGKRAFKNKVFGSAVGLSFDLAVAGEQRLRLESLAQQQEADVEDIGVAEDIESVLERDVLAEERTAIGSSRRAARDDDILSVPFAPLGAQDGVTAEQTDLEVVEPDTNEGMNL